MTSRGKSILPFLLFAACSLTASARSIVLSLSNGTKAYYLVSTEINPVMTFTDEGLTMNANQYSFAQVKSFYVSETDDPNGIKQILDAAATHQWQQGRLILTGETQGSVAVLLLNGTIVDAKVSQHDGCTVVDLSDLPSDTYIISTAHGNFKVLKH